MIGRLTVCGPDRRLGGAHPTHLITEKYPAFLGVPAILPERLDRQN